MKRILAAAIFTLSSLAACAQTAVWSLTPVPNETGNPVGYIYHVYSRGNVSVLNSRAVVASGLRFICSTKDKTGTAPIVAIYWGGVLMSGTTQEVAISVDNNFQTKEKWTREGSLIYTSLSDEASLVNALRKGRIATFTWEGIDSSKYTVAFELRNFNLTEFNNSCKLRT